MTTTPLLYSHQYADLDAKLTGRCSKSRKVGNNTYLERRPGGDIAVRLHQTDVVTFHADGTATLDSGGWLTVTTKSRMNDYLPGGISLGSVKGRWFLTYAGHHTYDADGNYLAYVKSERPSVPFADGITIDLASLDVIDGAPAPVDVVAEDQANKATRKAIDTYLKTTTAEEIVHAFDHAGGDCWACAGIIPDTDPADHLRNHVNDHYVMLSLTRNAVTERGLRYPDVILSSIYSDAQRGHVDRWYVDTVRKYLVRHLVTGVAVK